LTRPALTGPEIFMLGQELDCGYLDNRLPRLQTHDDRLAVVVDDLGFACHFAKAQLATIFLDRAFTATDVIRMDDLVERLEVIGEQLRVGGQTIRCLFAMSKRRKCDGRLI
jgi:hypothetical protein